MSTNSTKPKQKYSIARSVKKGLVTALYAALAYVATGNLTLENTEHSTEQIISLAAIVIARTIQDYIAKRQMRSETQ
jgi:uncharacterized membrane protein